MAGLRQLQGLSDAVWDVYDAAAGTPTRGSGQTLQNISDNLSNTFTFVDASTTAQVAALSSSMAVSGERVLFSSEYIAPANTFVVIRDVAIDWTGPAGVNFGAIGSHVVFYNCDVNFTAITENDTRGLWWMSRQVGLGTLNSNFRSTSSSRIGAANTTMAATSTLSFINNSMVWDTDSWTSNFVRVAGGWTDMVDTAILTSGDVNFPTVLQVSPGGKNENVVFDRTVNNVSSNFTDLVVLSEDTQFINSDFRNHAISAFDGGSIKYFNGPGVYSFVNGFAAYPSTGGFIKSVNPNALVTSISHNTAAGGINNTRVVETIQIFPQYNELTVPANGINIRVNAGNSFVAPDVWFNIDNTNTTIYDFTTNANGNLIGSHPALPITGTTTGLTIDANGNDAGLQIPVYTANRQMNDLTNIDSTIDIRSFYHTIGTSNYFVTYDSTAATPSGHTRIELAGRTNSLTTRGQAVAIGGLTSIDSSVSSAAIYSTGTTKRTPAQLETYFYNSVTGVLSTLTTVQNISDALKFEFSKYTTNAPNRVVSNGNEITYPGNITFNGTGSDLTPTFTSSGVTFGGRPAANALAPSAVTDTITQINAFTGSIRHIIDYNNFLVPTGWRFGHATHRNIQETTGGVINNAVITANAILEFERGSIYSFSNADTTAASLGSFDTMGTGSDLVRINVPAGDTGFDSIPTLNNPGNSTLRALLEGSGNFEFVDVPIPTAATYQVPANLRNGFFGVKNVTQDTELVAPVAVDPNTAATYSYTINSALYTSGDIIRVYWRPTTTLQAGYNTRVFEFTATRTDLVNTVPNGTFDLASPRIASVLWEGVVGTLNIPAATTSIFEFGDQDLNSVTRAEIEYADEPQILQSPTDGQPATLALTMLAANDVDYLSIMMDNNLLNDAITPGQGDTVVDSRYIYLNTINTTTQVTLTAISASGTSSLADLTPVSLQGIDGAFTVVIRINPAGATPAQIQAASLGALTSFFTNNAIGRAIRRALGFLVGIRLGNKGSRPYQNNGTQDTNYLNNL